MADAFVGNPADIHMGPAAVFFKPEGATESRCLGYTLNDSVKINMSVTPTPITPDQASLPIKDIITEMEVSVDVTLGEVNMDNLNLLPGVEEGVFSDPIGLDMKAIAGELTIIPIDKSDTKVYTMPKASPALSDGISFMKTTPQGLSLNFKVYVNDDDQYLLVTGGTASA